MTVSYVKTELLDGTVSLKSVQALRVERNENGTPEIRVSDGKITWRAPPNQKVCSKQELAQEADSEDSGKAESVAGVR